MYYKVLIDTFRSLALVYRKIINFKRLIWFWEKHLYSATPFRTLSAPPKLDYLCVNSTKRRYSENQYREITNVRGPKVVIVLRSSVFFWPRSFPSKSSKLLRGDIIWKEIICPIDWYIKYSRPIKGVLMVGIEMGLPNCMQNLESVESWRRYWYWSGETK